MKKIIKISLVILLLNISFDANSNNLKCERELVNYTDSLDKLVNLLLEEKNPEESLLLYCIPETSKESLKFFEIDYKKDKRYSVVFRKINALWLEKCQNSKKDFLVKYYEYSKFVDGYFAENYFINISKIHNKLGAEMCSYLDYCDEIKIKRLKIYLERKEFCK